MTNDDELVFLLHRARELKPMGRIDKKLGCPRDSAHRAVKSENGPRKILHYTI